MLITKEIFLENFRTLFDETEPKVIQFDTNFKDLDEWGSLVALTLIVHFDETYHVKLTPTGIQKSKTVEDLFKLL